MTAHAKGFAPSGAHADPAAELVPHDGPLPIAPGSSPYRVKGLTFKTIQETAESELRGGLKTLLAALPDEPLRRFLSQTFLAVGYYDALPIVPVTAALARLRSVRYADDVRERATRRAQLDLQLYHLLLRLLSPELAFSGFMRLWPRYFDFGQITVAREPSAAVPEPSRSASRWLITLADVPAMLVPWFVPMASGYVPEVLRAAGAQHLRFELVSGQRSRSPSLPAPENPPARGLFSDSNADAKQNLRADALLQKSCVVMRLSWS